MANPQDRDHFYSHPGRPEGSHMEDGISHSQISDFIFHLNNVNLKIHPSDTLTSPLYFSEQKVGLVLRNVFVLMA